MARLPGQVATCRAHFAYLLVADLHGAGWRTPGLGHVPGARAGDHHHSGVTGFAVVRGDRGGAGESLAIRGCARWALEDDVEPPIVRPGHAEAQDLVVGVGATDQHLPTTRQRVGEQASLLMVRR